MVRVEDRNDHAPLLVEPTCKCFVVKRTASRGLLVGRLRAEDADSGQNANVAFIARSQSDYFKVDLLDYNQCTIQYLKNAIQ